MSSLTTRALIVVSLAALSCKGKGEPTTSYCEAICDQAVSCAAAERTVDEDAMRDQCLADTRAADPSCEEAETGDLAGVRIPDSLVIWGADLRVDYQGGPFVKIGVDLPWQPFGWPIVIAPVVVRFTKRRLAS